MTPEIFNAPKTPQQKSISQAVQKQRLENEGAKPGTKTDTRRWPPMITWLKRQYEILDRWIHRREIQNLKLALWLDQIKKEDRDKTRFITKHYGK